jgi:hypothetical protein
MMLLVATTFPEAGAICGFTSVEELASELKEAVDAKAVAPESWLARGALVTLIVVGLATPLLDTGIAGTVLVQKMGICATRSPFAGGGDQSARRGAAHTQAIVELGCSIKSMHGNDNCNSDFGRVVGHPITRSSLAVGMIESPS